MSRFITVLTYLIQQLGTSKTIEIFNKYSNKDRVRVKGHLIIDNEEYSIERGIVRKKTKKGDWTVKTELKIPKDYGRWIHI